MAYQYRLSILVPVYNVEKYVERCIDSLLNQDMSRDEYEIIIVDDGSTDNSLSLIKSKYEGEKNIFIYTKPNGGLSSARNYALQYAKGKYIMHVDSDDFIEPNVIGGLVEMSEKHDVDLLFFLARFYPSLKITTVQNFEIHKIYTGEHILLNGMKVSSTWSNIYSHDFLKRVGIQYYGKISHQDVEYNYRLYPFAQRVMFTDVLVYDYFVEGESITHTKNIAKKEKNSMDNLVIVRNIQKFSKEADVSPVMSDFLTRRMNSTMVGQMLNILRSGDFDRSFVQRFMDEAKELGVYPIRGGCESWKTTLLSKFLNQQLIWSLLVKKYK